VDKTFVVVLFRPRDDTLSGDLVRRTKATRKIYASATVWKERRAARPATEIGMFIEGDHGIIRSVVLEIAEYCATRSWKALRRQTSEFDLCE
jgi:hypothetical protein